MLGVFGEAARLTPGERRTVVETVVAADPQLPLVVGVSALETRGGLRRGETNVLDLVDGWAAGGLMVQVARPATRTSSLGTAGRRSPTGRDQGIVVQDYPVVSGVSIAAPGDLVDAVRRVPDGGRR